MMLWRFVVAVALFSGVASAFPAEPTEVRGTVVGHDGKPMRSAVVMLSGPGVTNERQSADEKGVFRFALDNPGAYSLILAGVHHKTLFMPVFIERPGPLDLHVRLAASEYRPAFTDLRVVGEFNKFSTDSGGVAMQPQADGTFVAAVEWKGETLSYQIQGVLKGSDTICGTAKDAFALDKRSGFLDNADNQFVSVAKADGQPVRIVFDPRQLPRSASQPEIRFADRLRPAAALVDVARDFTFERRRERGAMEAYAAAGHDPATFKYDHSEQLRRLERWIEREREPVVKQCLMLRYFEVPESTGNATMARRVLSGVPPKSAAWSPMRGYPDMVFPIIAEAAHAPAQEEAYIAEAVETNPDRDVRAAFLSVALSRARARRDANASARLSSRLVAEFPGTRYARSAAAVGRGSSIQKGKPVPEFTLTSLDGSTTETSKTMMGRTYLIDFWALWCGPCVAEMANLHAAYDTYKDKGLRIVSVSLDEQVKDVLEFQKTKWLMPWFNARLSGFDNATAKALEVVSIPKPILIGPDGRILATSEELRGKALMETLARVFGTATNR